MSSVLSRSEEPEELLSISCSNLWMFSDWVCSLTEVVFDRMFEGDILWILRISSIFDLRLVWLIDLFEIWSEFKFVVFSVFKVKV